LYYFEEGKMNQPNSDHLTQQLIEWKQAKNQEVKQKSALSILNKVELTLRSSAKVDSIKESLKFFLNVTSSADFLQALPDSPARFLWADLAFKSIQVSRYTLLDMFHQRVQENHYKIMFQDLSEEVKSQFTYDQVSKHVKEIAAVFHNSVPSNPRAAIFCDNSIESACSDLACLFYDIFDTPLNIHFNEAILADILIRLKINLVVTDTAARLARMRKIRKKHHLNFKIFVTDSNIQLFSTSDIFLGEACKNLSLKNISETLDKRKRFKPNQVITTMFTSGSTGIPKGVSFSNYNMVSKRFGRAAALPEIGNNEVMLCYLPLFHTFGRFLELQGIIYWGGRYVFTGNPSRETLLHLFTTVNPTIFISVPLRWVQLYEEIEKKFDSGDKEGNRIILTRQVVGKKLKWGLSAAGYLDSKIFRFFQEQGILLCSGFGMTEATGGITMTPPGDYVDNSVGKPLPGVTLRFTRKRELEISGHYIARYLEDAGPGDTIAFPGNKKTNYFLPTGDIFRKNSSGHYEIVDRVKDIYKNNRGQTIAPRTVEQKFSGVPGIKNTFLVGDAKPYNVLLIVPDINDPFLKESTGPEHINQYFHHIITAANKDFAPFERIVNFKIIDRDFDSNHGELTPKGSFNRKIIVQNFTKDIELLYQSNFIELKGNGFKVVIPRWFFRDLGILEDGIQLNGQELENVSLDRKLPLRRGTDPGTYLIGDLIYKIEGKVIDLGLFARQPRLWLGNPTLIEFSPCKEGWDLPLHNISAQVFLPSRQLRNYPHSDFPNLHFARDQKLTFINQLMCCSLFSDTETALSCTKQIGMVFSDYDENIAVVIRRRLEALSRHRDEKIRVQAYQTLLLNDPHHDYSKLFPTFIQSGLSFLNEQSIREIATREIGKQKLESLRQRLYTYRKQLQWPASKETRHQFEALLKLLYHFALQNLDYYIPIRAELASWILHKEDPALTHYARKYFLELNKHFETSSLQSYKILEEADWNKKIRFDPGIIKEETEKINDILIGTIFLEQSVRLAYDDKTFELNKVPDKEIWISKLPSSFHYLKYRVSINTQSGKHYDLCLLLNQQLQLPAGLETLYYWAALSGHPYGSLGLPALGCAQPGMGVMSVRFMSELSGWDKVREYAGIHYSLGYLNKSNAWKKLFIKALKVFFTLWKQSNHKIIPGFISLENVVVPELDYLETATVLSLAGIEKYTSPLSLVRPMVFNFYQKTLAHFPWCKKQLKPEWIFDACMEACPRRTPG